MTPQINFDKSITATTTDGEILNFSLDMKIPGHRQIATAIQAIADAHASQQRGADINKFDCLNRSGGIDRSKLTNFGTCIGNH